MFGNKTQISIYEKKTLNLDLYPQRNQRAKWEIENYLGRERKS